MSHPSFPQTIGLIACGGHSSRMGRDKSLLMYHQKPQRYHAYDLIAPYCEQIALSVNATQTADIHDGYTFITDLPEYSDIGPMSAVLTGFTMFPQHNLLLIGSDYPLLTSTEIESFLQAITRDIPTAFFNESTGLYEPLLAWYPYTCFDKLKKRVTDAHYSLQQFLQEYPAAKYVPSDTGCMMSADTPADYEHIRSVIAARPDHYRTFDT